MRLAVIAVSLSLLFGCGHMGGLGRAGSQLGRAAEHVAADVGRVAAPVALNVARGAIVGARVAVAVASSTTSTAGEDELVVPTGTLVGDDFPPGVDPCGECPSDTTCFYEDYQCPAM